MQVLRRTVVALGAALMLTALVGCGGLGVNIGSGNKGSDQVAKVTIFVISGPNIPTVLANHFLTLQAVAYDSRNFISSTQGATWTAAGKITLYDPSCTNVVGTFDGTTGITTFVGPTQTICVFGNVIPTGSVVRRPMIASGNVLTATVQGMTGKVNITVQQ